MFQFEKPQDAIPMNLDGLTEEEAVKRIHEINASAPPHPSTLNLGCGPEPDITDLGALRNSAQSLLDVQLGEDSAAEFRKSLPMANKTGASFYWAYAFELVISELSTQLGEDNAIEVIYGDDRKQFHKLRAEKFRWIMKERFGFDMEETQHVQ